MGHAYKNIAMIGAGASGCMCAYFLEKAGFEVTLFDKGLPLRKAHENPIVKMMYDEYFEKPLSHKSHEILHTSYVKRDKYPEN